MMTAFLNGRYIYKNINPTTSKDDVIIMRYIIINVIKLFIIIYKLLFIINSIN